MATPITTQFLSYIISLIRHHSNENPVPINDLDDISLIKILIICILIDKTSDNK